MTPDLPLAHLVQAIPVLLPALVLPVGLVVWTIRDRRRARAEQAADRDSARPPDESSARPGAAPTPPAASVG